MVYNDGMKATDNNSKGINEMSEPFTVEEFFIFEVDSAIASRRRFMVESETGSEDAKRDLFSLLLTGERIRKLSGRAYGPCAISDIPVAGAIKPDGKPWAWYCM